MNAGHDENARPTIVLASSTNGVDIVQLFANPTNHGITIDDNTTGTDNGNNQGSATIDENEVSVWLAESSSGDGTLIEVYGNPTTNALLINSN